MPLRLSRFRLEYKINNMFSYKYFIYLFFKVVHLSGGCAGSSLLCELSPSRVEWGLFFSCGAQASPCGGFSCCGAYCLEHRLSSCEPAHASSLGTQV